jgi:hypothetical protein
LLFAIVMRAPSFTRRLGFFLGMGLAGGELGCGGRSAESVEVGALACDGTLDERGRVLHTDLAYGRVFTAGDRLIVVEAGGRVLSVDRCSGDGVELVAGLGKVVASVVVGEHVWFLAGGETLSLARLPVTGGTVETVLTNVGSSNLVTDGTRVYFFSGHGTSMSDVRSVDEDLQESSIASVTVQAGSALRLLAAGPAGLYFTFECDCTPSLLRLAPGESEPTTLEGAGSASLWGTYAVGVGPDRLYVAVNPVNGTNTLKRLPFAGGSAEELLPSGSARSTITATERHVSWVEGSLHEPRRLHTLSLTGARSLRELDSTPSTLSSSTSIAADAVYWLRQRDESEDAPFEIFAAAL